MHSDVAKIHQLFYNIVGNANKFTRNGKINININVEKISEHQQNLQVKIKDNGFGITPDDLEHIFENYQQGNIAAEVKNLGAGLGLNLCKEIVELFSGKINITSTPNVETVVTFNLVLDLPEKNI